MGEVRGSRREAVRWDPAQFQRFPASYAVGLYPQAARLYPVAGGGVTGAGIASIKAPSIDAEVEAIPKAYSDSWRLPLGLRLILWCTYSRGFVSSVSSTIPGQPADTIKHAVAMSLVFVASFQQSEFAMKTVGLDPGFVSSIGIPNTRHLHHRIIRTMEHS